MNRPAVAAALAALAVCACGPPRGAPLRFDATLTDLPERRPCATPPPAGSGLAALPSPTVTGRALRLVETTGSDRLGTVGRAGVAFSGDGTTLAVAQAEAVLLWDAPTATLRRALPYDGPPIEVDGVTLSDDGRAVRVRGRRYPKIAVEKVAGPDDDVAAEQVLPQDALRRSPNGQPALERAVSGDGARAAVVGPDGVDVVEVASGRRISRLPRPARAAQLALSHDGRLIALSALAQLTLLGEWRDARADERPPEPPWLEVWDVDRGERRWRNARMGGTAWVFTRDGRTLTGPPTRLVEALVDVATGEVRRYGGRRVVAVSPDSRFVAVHTHLGPEVLHLRTGAPTAALPRRGRLLTRSSDGLVASLGADGQLQLELPGGCVGLGLRADRGGAFAFTAGGRHLVAAAGSYNHPRLLVWDAATGALVRSLRGDGAAVTALAPGAAAVAFQGPDHRLRLFSPATGEALRTVDPPRYGYGLREPNGLVHRVRDPSGPELDRLDLQHARLSGDGAVLVTPTVMAKQVQLALWDAARGGLLADLPLDYDVRAAATSPDGRFAATGGDGGQVTLWDLRARRARPLAFRHVARVRLLVFSDDGELLATGGEDGKLLLMRTDTGARLATVDLAARFDRPGGASFSGDGRELLVTTERGAWLRLNVAAR